MQFQWRSVSDNLLLSPTVMLRFRLKITCPQVWTQIQSYCSVHGMAGYEGGAINTGATAVYSAAPVDGTCVKLRVPCLVFADGDAFASCCSSMNLVFNGTSISLNRCNRFWRDYCRTQVSCDDAARIYKSSGGSYDRYDQRPVVVGTATAHATNPQVVSAGITQE